MKNNLSSPWLLVGGWSLIIGCILGITTRYIWFLAHGPAEFDENNLVMGMRTLAATRIQLLPALLTIIGIGELFYVFHKRLKRSGRFALAAVLIGTMVAPFYLIWDYCLFPNPHSLWGGGWVILLVVVLPLTILGWLIFALSSLRSAIFPVWVKTLFLVMAGSSILDILYDPPPNHHWSELMQFALQAETEVILGQVALLGIGIFMLLQSRSQDLKEGIKVRNEPSRKTEDDNTAVFGGNYNQ